MDARVPTDAPAKAYSYVRFSTPQQQEGASFQRQMEKANKFALEHGLILDTELNMSDLGVSAFRGKNARTGALAGFLEAVHKGRVEPGSYLLVENIDRLSRDDFFEAQTLFQNLIVGGVNIAVLSNGEVYSYERLKKQPYDIIYIVAEQIRANQESARKSQLIGDAKARKKKRLIEHGLEGKPYTRVTPAWLTWNDDEKQYKLIPERAAIVREVFERTAGGEGLVRIARDLNLRGIETWTPKGKRKTADHWRPSYIRKMLTSTAPIGTFTPHTTTHDETTRARRDEPMTPVENMFPAAVDADTYWRVNRKFSTSAPRGRNAQQPAKSVIAGIGFCATCGHAMTRVSKGGYVYLVCSRANMKAGVCKYLAVRYGSVDKALRDNAHRLVKEAPRGKSTAALERQIDELQANADEAERRVDDMADLYAQERSPTAKRRLTEMERQLKEYQKQLRDLRAQRDTMTTASVKDRLKAVERVLAGNEDVIEVNKTLRDAVRRIVVDPEQGCLWIRWHHSDEIQDITFVTRHMSFEDFRETTPPMHALFPERMAAQSQSV
jgi:DNA invertase Pin-like site-specific DNA recombinase/nicotinamide mononucleotide adenylyltransferase